MTRRSKILFLTASSVFILARIGLIIDRHQQVAELKNQVASELALHEQEKVLDSILSKLNDGFKPRVVYPLSVLPGGVATVEEYRMKVQTDPMLAARFKGCDLEGLRQDTLKEDTTVFITFRRGNVIKWNSKPVIIHKGERLIIGCGKTVLMRCGNEISWTPQSPSEELPPDTLETPITEAPKAPPLYTIPPTIGAGTQIITTENYGPTYSGGFPGGDGGFLPPDKPTQVPEPGTWLLIAVSGLLALVWFVIRDCHSHFPWVGR